MMTLKLIDRNSYRTKIYEAAFFTITDECQQQGGYSRQITAHNLVGGEDQCWWIGVPPYMSVDDGRLFHAAYIMNSAGKTVESLSVPLGSGDANAGMPTVRVAA